MIQNFAIDQATFESLLFLSCEPKTAFWDSFRRETTKDGLPKWEAQLVARFRQFGRATNEIIKVGLVSERAPGADLAPASPLELVGFEIGVMDRTPTACGGRCTPGRTTTCGPTTPTERRAIRRARTASVPDLVADGEPMCPACPLLFPMPAVGGQLYSRHDLRHTVVSLLLELGTPPHVVQAIARHAHIDVTMSIYAHTNLDAMRQALDALEWREL